MDAPDYLLAILSRYSSKSNYSCLVCLPTRHARISLSLDAPSSPAPVPNALVALPLPNARLARSSPLPHGQTLG